MMLEARRCFRNLCFTETMPGSWMQYANQLCVVSFPLTPVSHCLQQSLDKEEEPKEGSSREGVGRGGGGEGRWCKSDPQDIKGSLLPPTASSN